MFPRWALLLTALVTLGGGVLAGLQRLGIHSAAGTLMAPWHGVIMTAGFSGLLISLERAVALERAWALGAPALLLVGTIAFALGSSVAPWVYALAGLWAVCVQATLARRRLDAASIVMALGTGAWAVGLALFAGGGGVVASSLFWAAFPVLVIAGERLELAFQVLPGGWAWWAFQGGVLASLGGALMGSVDLEAGAKLEALGFCLLALWMLRFDVLGRGFRQGGLQRFMSVALWTGYGWLFIAGALLFTWAMGLPAYWDGALHAVFLGFMFAMIFAHAPVIFPALSGVPLRWHGGHYGHLFLLSAGLSVRCASAFFESPRLKLLGSYGATGALGLFLLNQGLSVYLARLPKE